MKSHFKKIELEQNTPEWEAWRSEKIGASEIPAVLGESSYKTRNKLLKLKKTGEKEEFNDFTLGIFRAGHVYEEMMRPIISSEYELDLQKACYEDNMTGFLSASYDGLDEVENIGWECKNSKKEMEFITKTGKPSPNYYAQVQTQIYVRRLNKVLFTAGVNATERKTIEVLPDEEYQKRILDESLKFYEEWTGVKKAPPQLGPLIALAGQLKKDLAVLKKKHDKTMKEIKDLNWDKHTVFEGFEFSVSKRNSMKLDEDKLCEAIECESLKDFYKDKLDSALEEKDKKLEDFEYKVTSSVYNIKEIKK